MATSPLENFPRVEESEALVDEKLTLTLRKDGGLSVGNIEVSKDWAAEVEEDGTLLIVGEVDGEERELELPVGGIAIRNERGAEVSEEEQEFMLGVLEMAVPQVYERLAKFRSSRMKLMVEVPKDYVDALEVLLRKKHGELNPAGSTFITVDMEHLLEESGVSPWEVDEELVYKAAVEALPLDEGAGDQREGRLTYYLSKFQDRCDRIVANYEFHEGQRVQEEGGRGRNGGVCLFIKNIDTVTAELTKEEANSLMLAIFRVGGNFSKYGHYSSDKKLSQSMQINDVNFVRQR